ncbi:GDSL-type esterase/lipase family protein [Fumia xinanensis]|uniref:Acylhydrolase n=1 Tax=Fumia xinanensis TaxID=2763659 RepID=A0A926I6K9_9FIRM|nr:GDSL-type esterase/lipase family protein [Fumia xinanensis]MBC8558961.1 acylhydrolase [Fumia xinanensis]
MKKSINKSVWRRSVVAVLTAALITAGLSSCGQDDPSSEESSGSSVSISDSQPSTDSSISEQPSQTPPESSSEPVEEQSSEAVGNNNTYKQYDYTASVPAGAAVDNSYFDDAVFIGDSRTQGFIIYNGLSNATTYMDKGLKVDTAFTKADIEVNGVKMSAMDALAQNKTFKRVYVMLGVNELGWAYSDIFIEKYGELVDKIKEIKPDAEIYIQSILPVSEKKSSSDKIYNMTKINEYNSLIKKMAEDKKVYYLNVAEAVADSSGYLPAEASTDGVHLNKEYCGKWLDYLKNHTAGNIGQ